MHAAGRLSTISAPTPRPTRRAVLVGGLFGTAGALLGCTGDSPRAPATTAPAVPGVDESSFALGVASGDPLPDGVVLWTRLVPADPLGDRSVPVEWQVATDEGFGSVVAGGTVEATAALAHSVHADVRGLEPAREYFYRFRVGTATSPAGRTRTLPAPDARPERVRFGVACCQHWEQGFWPAYTALADEDVDLVVHLGDYIYEYPPAPDAVRTHTLPSQPDLGQLVTLDDYRARYAQYKGDAALRAAHARAPWLVTWDDHEVENNHAGLVDEPQDTGPRRQDPAQFARQRAAAYQAWYEHMPVRVDFRPGPDLQIYRRVTLGDLMQVDLLDTRQYRTPHPCDAQDFAPATCGEENVDGTLTGDEQERWLRDGLEGSSARWNVVAQQTLVAQVRGRQPGETTGPLLTLIDQNDGYVPYRTRLLQTLAATVDNPVLLSGDIHSAWVTDLRPDFDRPETPAVAPEFCATSISSRFEIISPEFVQSQNDQFNPHVRYFNGAKRGYTVHSVTPAAWTADFRVVEDVRSGPQSPVSTDATWVVEAGRHTAERA